MFSRFFALIFCVALTAGTAGAFLRSMMPVQMASDIHRAFSPEPTPASSELSVAGGVVPHHLLAREIIENFFKNLSQKDRPETIVILSPDHFNASAILGSSSFIGPGVIGENFDGLSIDKNLLRRLYYRNILTQGESFIALEHGITVLTPFIKNYFPGAKIMPLLVPAGLSREKAEELAEILNAPDFQNSHIIASVDFSHYLPESAASFHDVKSVSVLLNFRQSDFKNIEVDCWQCLYAVRFLAGLRQQEELEIIARKNSVDLWKGEPPEETTSYFSVIFKKSGNSPENEENFNGRTILFLGDIMLGRHVEHLMEKNGYFYPFENLRSFLAGTDIVFGNLEGPISEKPEKFPANSLKFSFSPAAAESLSSAGINLVSLANNHLLDTDQPGLAETKNILKKSSINFVGDPLKCASEFSFRHENLIFLAFNKTYPHICPEKEIAEAVKNAKLAAEKTYLAVSIHWGEEYQSKSSDEQQKLARLMIEAGADAVFGHHPHVVQEIEIYRNKPIFYSLGNFVFDQYFSEETRQGLAVGSEIFPGRAAYRLFPVKIQLSQPILMGKEERQAFLAKLASKSAPELAEKIKSGIIKLDF